jgi:arylsulfatase A
MPLCAPVTLRRLNLFAILLAAALIGPRLSAAGRPNFVIVLCDDLGYRDLACFGDPVIQTPHLDRFAAEGLKLTACYAASANCSPARTGLMTGRTPYRVGIHNWIPFLSPMHLRSSEITIATLLQNAGYDTCHVGKWHLNGWFNLPGQPQPGDHGFGHWFSTQNNCLPNHRNPYSFVRNGIPMGPIEGYASHIVVDEATRWLTQQRDRERPFFLYVCFHEPHEPIATDEQYSRLYPSDDPSLSAHHGNITQMDAAFGRLMQRLDDEGLRDSTFVLFTSDNGPAVTNVHPHGSAGPLREIKGHIYEGGIRVPGIVRWPGRVRPGSVSDEPVCGVDVLPTFCELAGVEPPRDRVLDGTSLAPLLEGQPLRREKPLYWQFNYAQTAPKVAIRDGDWKLVAMLDLPAFPPGADITDEQMRALKTAEPIGFELYNLRHDAGEQSDLKTRETERFERMRTQLVAMYHEVRDESPVWPAWTWTRDESLRIEWPPYRNQRR